jgi:hypothetical protein
MPMSGFWHTLSKVDGRVLAGQRLSPPREYLAQFAMVKATRKLEAPNQKEPIMDCRGNFRKADILRQWRSYTNAGNVRRGGGDS